MPGELPQTPEQLLAAFRERIAAIAKESSHFNPSGSSQPTEREIQRGEAEHKGEPLTQEAEEAVFDPTGLDETDMEFYDSYTLGQLSGDRIQARAKKIAESGNSSQRMLFSYIVALMMGENSVVGGLKDKETDLSNFREEINGIIIDSQSKGESYFSSNFNLEHLGLSDYDLYDQSKSRETNDPEFVQALLDRIGDKRLQPSQIEFAKYLLAEKTGDPRRI